MPPLVSILIPVYNCRPWVARAVESALEQTWPNVEVIALDDASTDGSWEVLQEWRSKIRVERSPRNGGQNVSRNLLTTLSRGEWLVFLDADDELAPDSVEQKMMLADAAEAVYGSTDCSTFEEQKLLSSVKTVAVDYEDMLAALFSWKLPNTSAYAFQKKALLDAGGWNESVVKFADYGMCIPMLLQGCRFQAAPQAWSTYRQWSSKQVSRQSILQSSLVWLKLLRDATQEMEQRNLMTQARGQAIFDSSLGTIKGIYQFDRSRALLEHRALQDWSRSFTPSVPPFTTNYSRLYRWLGFVLAERLNTIRRRFKHVAEVTYEALACGLPVVTTRATGSVVRDRREGRIVPERDPKALADAIEQIVEDGARRDQLAIAARQRAHEFTWEKYGERLVSALRHFARP